MPETSRPKRLSEETCDLREVLLALICSTADHGSLRLARLSRGSDKPAKRPGSVDPVSICLRNMRTTKTSPNRLSTVSTPQRCPDSSDCINITRPMLSGSADRSISIIVGSAASKGFDSPLQSTFAENRTRSSDTSKRASPVRKHIL